jgi:acyl carrier protein
MNKDEVRNEIRAFLIENIFEGKDNGQLKDDTALISSRIMDSIVALKLVSHLEEKFGIELEAHEVDQENLDSINKMVDFIATKK